MKRITDRRLWIVCGLVGLSLATVARAWHGPGHEKANRLTVAGLPEEMPAFFRAGVGTIAHCSADPDLFRLPAYPELRDGEAPEHFIDLELLKGRPLPATRSAFVDLCAREGLKPSEVGMVPYAVVEWTQRLTIAFAEHRKWPKNKHIQSKCLVYAGLLSHYAQDACQPLHTTIHYDGRAGKDGTSPRTGIHTKVDALLQKVKAEPQAMARGVKCVVFDKLMPAVEAEIKRAHALVDEVYRLEDQIPPFEKPLPADSKVADFAKERLRACANFTGSLFLTAWRNSAGTPLPDWHIRRD